MVTLGSFQSPTFQAFHGSASPYDEALSCRSLELALSDAVSASARSGIEERPRDAPKQAPTRRISVMVSDKSGSEEADRPRAPPAYTASSASHRLFRTMKPETSSSWKARSPSEENCAAKVDVAVDSSSWKAPDAKAHPVGTPTQDAASGRFDKSPSDSKATGHDDKPSNANEILDGSDVLQQISNVTSTEPSNEREVFVGGLRESEDSVHITEEELATYFSRFGIIESVSINRDDRTHRGRGFAFVKFFQESAALNAVMADASTHVIRGTTVSVQWSRGAKDAGGDRPRRRNSGSSGNNGGSPSRGGNRSSPKMGNFSGTQKGAGHRGGGSSCGSSCTHGYSPHRSRSQGHLHPSGGGVPYAYCPGHGTDHMNQQLVCVMVPAQRAAALGLPHHTHSLGSCTSRSGSAGDVHFVPLAQSNGGHSGYPSHTRSHSHTPSSPCHSGGGYSPYAQSEHHPINIPHHPPQKTSRSYAGHPAMHMPPVHQSQRRGRGEPRGHAPHCGGGSGGGSGSSGGSSGGSGGSSSYSEYERLQYEFAHPHNNSYPPQEWSNDGTVRSMRHGMMRSQSPPTLMRTSQGRSGGGAPRPPATTLPQPYDSPYCYAAPGHSSSGAIDGFTGVSTSGRRHSGSSAMNGRHSVPQDGLTPSSFYFSAGDCGNEQAYDRDYGYAGPSRMP